MIATLLTLMAAAGPASALPRQDEALTRRRWWTVLQEPHAAARPKWRNRRGAWDCWTWPDGVAARCRELKRRAVLQDIVYDLGGQPHTTTTFVDSAATNVRVHSAHPRDLEVVGWTSTQAGEWMVTAPVPARPSPEGWTWELPEAVARAKWVPEAEDAPIDTLTSLLRMSCDCVIEDRSAVLVHDRLAVRFRMRGLDPDQNWVAELWRVPQEEGSFFLSFQVSAGQNLAQTEHRLALGRAVISQLRPAPEGT